MKEGLESLVSSQSYNVWNKTCRLVRRRISSAMVPCSCSSACGAVVCKLAAHGGRLAEALPDRILVYARAPAAAGAGPLHSRAAPGDSAAGVAVDLQSPTGLPSGWGDASSVGEAEWRGGSGAMERRVGAEWPVGRGKESHSACAWRYHAQACLLATPARPLECTLLLLAARHVVLCGERSVAALPLGGQVREGGAPGLQQLGEDCSAPPRPHTWALPSPVRYMRVAPGGPPGRETLLLGLRSGAALALFLGAPAPLPLLAHPAPIRCLDLSPTRRLLALVDEGGALAVHVLPLHRGGSGGLRVPGTHTAQPLRHTALPSTARLPPIFTALRVSAAVWRAGTCTRPPSRCAGVSGRLMRTHCPPQPSCGGRHAGDGRS